MLNKDSKNGIALKEAYKKSRHVHLHATFSFLFSRLPNAVGIFKRRAKNSLLPCMLSKTGVLFSKKGQVS